MSEQDETDHQRRMDSYVQAMRLVVCDSRVNDSFRNLAIATYAVVVPVGMLVGAVAVAVIIGVSVVTTVSSLIAAVWGIGMFAYAMRLAWRLRKRRPTIQADAVHRLAQQPIGDEAADLAAAQQATGGNEFHDPKLWPWVTVPNFAAVFAVAVGVALADQGTVLGSVICTLAGIAIASWGWAEAMKLTRVNDAALWIRQQEIRQDRTAYLNGLVETE